MSRRPVSLRARLVAVVLAAVALALVAAGVAAHGALRSFLVDRVDRDLVAARGEALRQLDGLSPGGGPGGRDGRSPLPAGAVAELRQAVSGPVLASVRVRDLDGRLPPPLPTDVPPGYSTATLGEAGAYRVLRDAGVAPLGPPGAIAPGAELVVAVPLEDVEATLTRLMRIELAVGAATLLALALLALWLVRLGLRPLERIGRTADAIAAGDLSARVADADERTETGRLGRTLNGMLDRIEALFAERRRSEERLRRFVSDASHELQTPLTSVRGYAELFRRGAADRPEDLAVAMRRIEAEAARMGVLVDDLLQLARLDEGRPARREPVDLAALAADAVMDARAVEPGRTLTLDAPEPVVVAGDEGALRQVLANLLANVRAHTPAGAPARVRAAADGGHGVLEVSDSGPGLAPDEAARVFERFFRADPSRARTSGGSGLGLSIVAAIAEAHGGRCEVRTAPGEGATFRVLLPRAGAHPLTGNS